MKTKMKSLLLGVIVTLVILGAISINPAMADHIEIDNDLPLLVDPDISYHFINNTSGSVNLTPFSTSYNAFINLYDAKIFLIQNDEILYHSVHNNIGTGFAPTGFYSGQPHSPINDIDDIIIRIEVTSGYYQMTAPIDGVYSIFKSDTTGTESSPRYFSTNPTVPILQIVTITEIHEYSVFVYSDSDDTRYETSSISNNHRATFEITSDTHTITSLFPGVGYTNTASCEINGGASDTTFTVGAGDFVRCTFDYTYTEPSFDDFERSSPGLQSEFASDPIYIAPGGFGSFCDENSINIYQSMGFSAPHLYSYYESRLLITDADGNIVYRDAIDVYEGGVDFCLNINDLPFGFDAESSSFIVEVRDTYGNGLDEWSTNAVAYNSNADDIITSFERCDDTFFRPTSIIDPNLNHDLCLTYAYGEFPMTLELKGNDGSLAGFSYLDSTLDIITYINQFGTNKTQISFPEAATTFDLSDSSQFTAKLFFIPQDHPLDDQSHAAYPTHNSVFSLTKVVTGTDIVFTLDTETFPDDYDPIIYNTNYRLEITDTHNAGVTEGYVINYITHFLDSKIHLDTYDYFKEFSHLLDDPVTDARCDDTFFKPTSIIDPDPVDPNLNHDLCLTYTYGEFPMTLELKGNDGSLAGFSYTDSTLDIITYIDQFGTNKTQISFPEAATTFDLSDSSQFTAKLFFIPQDLQSVQVLDPLDDQSHEAFPTHNSVFSLTKVVTGTDIVFTLDTETFPDDYDPIIYNTNYRLEITDTHDAGVTEGYVINYIIHVTDSKIHLDTYDYFKEFSYLLARCDDTFFKPTSIIDPDPVDPNLNHDLCLTYAYGEFPMTLELVGNDGSLAGFSYTDSTLDIITYIDQFGTNKTQISFPEAATTFDLSDSSQFTAKLFFIPQDLQSVQVLDPLDDQSHEAFPTHNSVFSLTKVVTGTDIVFTLDTETFPDDYDPIIYNTNYRLEITDTHDAGVTEGYVINYIIHVTDSKIHLDTYDYFKEFSYLLDDPVTDDPVTDDPVTDDPVTDDPVTDDPVTDDPVTDDPVTDDPVTDDPVTDDPVTDDPVTDDPVTDDPVTDDPVTDDPVTDDPVTDDPVTDDPVTDDPVTDDPVTDDPVTDDPVTDRQTPEPSKKRGNGGDDGKTRPTFGISEQTLRSIVTCGYSMDGMCTDVNKYHVDYTRQSIQTGSTHDFTLKAYAHNGMKAFVIGFGVKEVGSPVSESEAIITVNLSRDYSLDSTYVIDSVEYNNDNNVIGEDATFAISKVPCNAASNTAQCTELSISDVLFREAMYDEPFLIEAIDMKRKSTTHFMNEGLLITGDSLNDPPITELSKKISSQSGFIVYELTRTDKINNIWTDQFGYTWSESNPGNWFYVDGPKPIVSSACTNTNNRYCDVFADKIKWHTDNMENMRDSIYGDIYTIAEFDDLDDPVTFTEIHGNSRTQFLEDNGLMWLRK